MKWPLVSVATVAFITRERPTSAIFAVCSCMQDDKLSIAVQITRSKSFKLQQMLCLIHRTRHACYGVFHTDALYMQSRVVLISNGNVRGNKHGSQTCTSWHVRGYEGHDFKLAEACSSLLQHITYEPKRATQGWSLRGAPRAWSGYPGAHWKT